MGIFHAVYMAGIISLICHCVALCFPCSIYGCFTQNVVPLCWSYKSIIWNMPQTDYISLINTPLTFLTTKIIVFHTHTHRPPHIHTQKWYFPPKIIFILPNIMPYFNYFLLKQHCFYNTNINLPFWKNRTKQKNAWQRSIFTDSKGTRNFLVHFHIFIQLPK